MNESQRQAIFEDGLERDRRWYTDNRLRGTRKSEGLLFLWGEATRSGWWSSAPPPDPDKPRLSVHFGPSLPSRDWYLDISRAFASLHPATRGLANTGQLAWYAHAPAVSRAQQVLWLFYVDGWGLRKFREDWKVMGHEARALLLELDEKNPGVHVVPEDGRGDDLIAARLRVSRRTVYYDRNRAIDQMLAFLQPQRPAESAA